MSKVLRYRVILLAAFLWIGCGGEELANQNEGEPSENQEAEPSCAPQFADENGEPFELLSEYCFFEGELAAHQPVDGVVPYDVTAPLYSDMSEKRRFIVLPEGGQIGFSLDDHWDWPDGSIIVKTFYYPLDKRDPFAGERILETRLLMKKEGSWEAESYLWDEDQEEARRHNLGKRIDVSFIDEKGESVEVDYRMPNRNQCRTCHGQDGEIRPLGPRAYQLTNAYQDQPGAPSQLERFEELGFFEAPLPELNEVHAIVDYRDESVPLEDRARSYLDANCAHCHNPRGRASSSNLFLGIEIDEPGRQGICKFPVAAGGGAGGRTYDIVPGAPDESILVYRMETTDLAIKMPELPLTTNDPLGIGLVRDWISAMEPEGCP